MIIEKVITDFINNASMGLVIFDSNEKIVTANSRIFEIIGVKFEEIKGMSATEFILSFFTVKNKAWQYIDCKNDKQIILAKRNNSSYIMRFFYVSKILSESYFVLSVVDVSNIKEYRESEANSRGIALMKSIIEFIPDILFAVNKNGKVIVWNKTAENMTDVSKKDILGKGNYEYAIPLYGKRIPILIDYTLTGKKPDKRYKSVKYENGAITAIVENARLKGERRILWGKASRFYDFRGNIMG
ncbi:MAG: PAS domain S-box protein, partial [Caldisericaceae bacterium]|nr:PAS domain S-box protein [Caldisericaceae bacterium]